MLRLVARFLKVLNSEADPGQIALALCLAAIFGLTPLWTAHNLLVLLLVLVLRVNLSSFLVGWAVFSALGYLLDPLFDRVGFALLTAGPLHGMWTAFYGTVAGRITRFNNTVELGSVVISLALFPVIFLLARALVLRYRASVRAWVQHSRLMTLLRASRLYHVYRALDRG
ncbi:MAG TPA: TIGR03546 family protein [Gammaproteobacteria bacterium]|nr:TIGR03546 family protein [Gammaproteobacteria bacterium]